MLFNALIASSIVAFASAAPAPVDYKTVDYCGVDWNTVKYDVDWKTVDYSGIDWNTVKYDVDWKTVNYGAPTPAAAAAAGPTPVGTPAAASSAAPAATSAPAVANAFNFISTRSGDINVHLRPLYAKGNAIRIGGTVPNSQTPNVPQLAGFPTTSTTSFLIASGRASLAVSVPGGQQVYVNSDGRLSYTVPHSGNTGTDSTVTGFSVASSGSSNVNLNFNGKNSFLACPVSGAAGEYDIYAAEKTTRTDCTGISILGTPNANPPQAWQW
ncbi:hypothetical protein BCR37DRAFT_395467 [Protomyces lactucae-debilis]|uniref:Uncharacterized protein n=1 Tax=Protomyces lactucae-debilis TaxID=2754530 RepID=A0A1Y2EW28_PROLT|nr:uncharacterized protein BCR37DRAFT_395467 [Protomyces lactucae-debilis]ORY75789.1 hypothetical protein BCR37DRAFT_395467 [Protomyces lactucae-debilis]